MKWYTHKRGKYIAITEKEGAGNPKWDVARTYTDEHARLISSAPDLLEACEIMVGYVSAQMESGFDGEWELKKLEAAIKRATGD